MPRQRSKNWYERLDNDTQAIVLGVGFIIFMLVLVFFLSNPVLAAIVFGLLGLGVFTIYSKYKTGKWWFSTYIPERAHVQPLEENPSGAAPVIASPALKETTVQEPSVQSSMSQPTYSLTEPFPQPLAQLSLDQQVDYLTRAIQSFHPPRNPPNELAYHDMLVSNLQTNYPAIKLHRQIGSEIDAVVGRVGIEAKLFLRKQEADRLYSQLDTFLHDGYIDRIIVVLYQPSAQWENYLNEKLARRGWLQKQVRVITV